MVEFEGRVGPAVQETEIPRMGAPELIQGGMGVGVSGYKLGRAVAIAGAEFGRRTLGVVSNTGVAIPMASRLQRSDLDDPDAWNTRRALEAFPIPGVAQEILEKYKPGGKRLPRKPQLLMSESTSEEAKAAKAETAREIIVANFVEIWLAKEGHNNPIGVNYLEELQMPRLCELYGAMLAGVDYVLMGAGIPDQVPGVLDSLARSEEAHYLIDVINDPAGYIMRFNPRDFFPDAEPLKRPKFLPIISSDTLAAYFHRKVAGFDGFVVEGPTAGGHNAPPRGNDWPRNENGEPIYGDRDRPNLDKIRALGKPFWLAGGYSGPEKIEEAKSLGAAGIQMGSAFALSKESGITEETKAEMRKLVYYGDLSVLTSAIASPTNFPFQIAQLPGTLSQRDVYEKREKKRVCGYGYLDKPRKNEKGKIEFICPAEPVRAYVAKGGKEANTHGRMCLCTALAATVGCARAGEPPVVTFGKDYKFIRRLIEKPDSSYEARDVVQAVLLPEEFAKRKAGSTIPVEV